MPRSTCQTTHRFQQRSGSRQRQVSIASSKLRKRAQHIGVALTRNKLGNHQHERFIGGDAHLPTHRFRLRVGDTVGAIVGQIDADARHVPDPIRRCETVANGCQFIGAVDHHLIIHPGACQFFQRQKRQIFVPRHTLVEIEPVRGVDHAHPKAPPEIAESVACHKRGNRRMHMDDVIPLAFDDLPDALRRSDEIGRVDRMTRPGQRPDLIEG
jgi:hypothetical protein